MSLVVSSDPVAASEFRAPEDHFFRHFFCSLRCGVITIDMKGRITSLNELACRILELNDPVRLGSPCSEVLKDHPKLAGYLVESFRMKNQPNRAEMELRLKDERKRTIGFSLPLIRDGKGEILGAALLFRDLTQIEHHEEQEKLKERLAALGQMAAGMAHEIRNPLGGIELTASLLRRRMATRREDVSLLDKIISEVKRLNRTVVECLEYVRPLHLDRKPCSLEEVIRDSLRHATPFLEGKKIEIRLNLDRSIPPVWIDSHRVRDALINLLRNAFEAIPRLGSVRVETRRENLPYSLRLEPEAGSEQGGTYSSHAVVRIIDTGKGIPEESRERLFYPFYTTKPSGSGVGLPLARKIVEGHGGFVDFDSEVGRGTTFVVRLPLAEHAAPEATSPPIAERRSR